VALRIPRNRQDAEDVVQECFLQAFRHFDSFAGRAKLSTWVSKIGVNAALMRVRRRRKNEISLEGEWEYLCTRPDTGLSQPTPDQQVLRRELERSLHKRLSVLNPSLSAAVKLRYFDERSVRECAQILGISLSNAKARLFRARLKLRPPFGGRFPRPSKPSHVPGSAMGSRQSPSRQGVLGICGTEGSASKGDANETRIESYY